MVEVRAWAWAALPWVLGIAFLAVDLATGRSALAWAFRLL